MDPGTLPQLTKLELFAAIAKSFQLLTIIEESFILNVVRFLDSGLHCCKFALQPIKIAGWFQSSKVRLDACCISLQTKYWKAKETSLLESLFSNLTWLQPQHYSKGDSSQTFSLEFAENVATKLNNPNYNVIEFFLIKSGMPDAC